LRASEPAAEILSERSESKDLLQKSVAAEPISRILSAARSGRAIIPLGRALLRGSSDLPGSCGAPSRHAVPEGTSSPIWSCSVWGLPCHRHYWRRGALLPHLFTLTPPNSAQRFIPVGAPGSPFFWANLGCDPPVALTCLLLAIVGSPKTSGSSWAGRCIFCGTFRKRPLKAAPRTLSGTPLCGVRTFLSRAAQHGLKPTVRGPAAITRPSS